MRAPGAADPKRSIPSGRQYAVVALATTLVSTLFERAWPAASLLNVAMQLTPALPDPCSDVLRVADARARLDRSITGYNRHSLISDRYRHALEHFQQAQARCVELRSTVEETHAAVAARQAARAQDVERWRDARAAAAVHRAGVEHNVREYVHSLRDEGMAPEHVLVAVKRRLLLVVSDAAPDAPTFEASRLAVDVGTWAISAYFDAA
jgi:hypothetical protein